MYCFIWTAVIGTVFILCDVTNNFNSQQIGDEKQQHEPEAARAAAPNASAASTSIAPWDSDPIEDGWGVWIKAWDNYPVLLNAVSGHSYQYSKKHCAVKCAIGRRFPPCLIRSHSLQHGATSSYDDFKTADERLFVVKGSKNRTIKSLLNRRQYLHESVTDYITQVLNLRCWSNHLSCLVSLTVRTTRMRRNTSWLQNSLWSKVACLSTAQQLLLHETTISMKEFSKLASAAQSAEVLRDNYNWVE